LKHKLILLNIALLAALVAEAWRFREDWLVARVREQALLRKQPKPQPPPPVIFSKAPEPVMAASYADIAEKMLFSKDRNAIVVVEVKAAPVKPMPPLPLLYGVMNLPDGVTAVMSEKTGGRHRGVRLGEQVGEFKLLAVDAEDITLEWDGKEVVKKIDDLIDRAGPPQAASEGSTPRAAPPGAQASSKQLDTKPQGKPEPGVPMNDRMRACQAGDTSPAGTQSGGFRKVVTATPFGNQCRWEPL